MSNNNFPKFKEKIIEMDRIRSALSILGWDSHVMMPPKGAGERGKTVATLTSILHEKFTNPEFAKLLYELKEEMSSGKLDVEQSVIVREILREYEKEKKLPKEFVSEMAQVTSDAHNVWVEARKKSDFGLFVPILSKIIDLKRKQASYYGYINSPYDALLDDYEPDLASDEVSLIFDNLKKFLVPLLKQIKEQSEHNQITLKGKFDLSKQKKFNELILEKIGYDLQAGRLDESAHPFSIGVNPTDARITTRYDEQDVYYSILPTIHEAGHALYEQGLNPEHFGTPLGTAVSVGIHESQSRTWENLVGKSMEFWKYFFPRLQEYFPEPFTNIKLEDFYRAINKVEPSLIRVEADEVTYNLHIIIRFEIEKELIEGSIEVADVPTIWNSKYKEYLGVDVANDSEGVLQDMHWALGAFGYFPTYTLGNLYSAQFFQQAKKEIMNLETLFEKGQFQPFLEWLRKNIHQHGKMYPAKDLCERVTGEGLNSKHYIDYLKQKFGNLYNIK